MPVVNCKLVAGYGRLAPKAKDEVSGLANS
jgi:hypothetical protein